MPPYPPRISGRHRIAGVTLSLLAFVVLMLDQLALALVLLVPIFLLARTVDRLDRPVEEEMTDALLRQAWVMTPADRAAAFERWSERFGAVRDRDEVRSALEAMPGGMPISGQERRSRISGGGLANAAGFVLGTMMFVLGLATFAVGRPAPASAYAIPMGLLIAVTCLMTARKSARSRASGGDGGPSRPSRSLRKRTSAVVFGSVIGVMVVSFLAQKLGLGEPDAAVLPPMPVAPEGVVEYRGTTTDGMEMVLWRRPERVFIRVDSERSACGIGRNYAGHELEAQQRRRFGGRWTYETSATFSHEDRLFGPREEVLPKRVDVEAYGVFLPGGRAEGGFTRRDVIRDGDETVLDCTRSVDWTARKT